MNEFERGGVMTELSEAQVLAALNATVKPESAAPDLSYWGEVTVNTMTAALQAFLAATAPVEGDEREALIESATWALIEYDTDTVDRGVRDEHYRERRADVERVAPILANLRRPSTPTDKEILRERSRQIEKGYDAAHDDEHGLDHLLFWAQRYGMEGKHLESLALVQAAREYLPRHQASTPTEEDVERVGDAIERVGGWKHLRRYSGMTPEWMDRLRSGIVRAALSAVHPEVTQ